MWDGTQILGFTNQMWSYYQFIGKKWINIRDTDKILYLKNAYRVLLTRARQGMVIFIPHGNENDLTSKTSFYNQTFEYLKGIGVKEIR